MNTTDIQRVFRAVPGVFVVVAADAGFTVVTASDDYLRATHTDSSIFGRRLFEVFPNHPGDPGSTGVNALSASLRQVTADRAPQTMGLHRYGARRSGGEHAAREEHDWTAVNAPVLADSGEVMYIVHTIELTTAPGVREAIAQLQIAAGREHLEIASENQRRIYETALNSTPDFVYVFDLERRALYANEALLKTWGVQDVRGKTWLDLGYEQWHADMHNRELDEVIRTRAPVRGEIPFTGTQGTRTYDYIFAPVLDSRGEVVAVAGTTRDITERQQAETALREQAVQLAAADRAKDDFLATLSHELRNPLAPLRNAIVLLRRAGTSDEKTQKINGLMERQVDHMVRLVDDLLEVSRISRGSFLLQKERVELASVVHNAIETSEPLIQAAGHALTVELPPEPLWLDGDPVRLAQILSNLLNNAASYTEHGGRIRVRASHHDGHAILSVRDSGMGIAPEAMSRIFEMFSRGERDSARNQGGLGIGLALSRRLAQMHGGSLEAHSEGPGQGAEFTFRMPLAQVPPDDISSQKATDVTLSKTRILVVDDNRDAGDTLAMVLDMLGAEVRVVRDGAQALEAFPGYAPTVVLLDIGMPGMNGYEVARAIRSRWSDLPCVLVALTGWGQEDDRRRAKDAGFDHHMVKPVEIEALQQLLASLET